MVESHPALEKSGSKAMFTSSNIEGIRSIECNYRRGLR